MHECPRVRQIPGEPRRRWFESEELDLIVRTSDSGEFIGFELCYDKTGHERSLSWGKSRGFCHMAVDSGEHFAADVNPLRYKAAPILIPDGACDVGRLYATFLAVSHSLPQDVSGFVLDALKQHPDFTRSV